MAHHFWLDLERLTPHMDRATRDRLIDEAITELSRTGWIGSEDQIASIRLLRLHAAAAERQVADLTAKLEAAEQENTDWHLVADGVKHHPDCVNNAATGGSVLTCYRCQAERLTEAMRVIYKGLREDEKGEFWTVEKWLKAQGVYTDNLQGHRMLIEAAKIALKQEG